MYLIPKPNFGTIDVKRICFIQNFERNDFDIDFSSYFLRGLQRTRSPILELSMSNGFVSSKIFKRNDFYIDFSSYFLRGLQRTPFARVSSHVTGFNARNKILTA